MLHNVEGSSKAMEPDAAAELVKLFKQSENFEVKVVIIDDYTTTASKLRETLPHSFDKWSDTN